MNGNKGLRKYSRNSPKAFKVQGFTRLTWSNNMNNQLKFNTIDSNDKTFFKQTLGPQSFHRGEERSKPRPLSMKKSKGMSRNPLREKHIVKSTKEDSMKMVVKPIHLKKMSNGRQKVPLSRTDKFAQRLSSLCEIYKMLDSKKPKESPYVIKNKAAQKISNRPLKITIINQKEYDSNHSLLQDVIKFRDSKLSVIPNHQEERSRVTQDLINDIGGAGDQLTFRTNNRKCLNKSYEEVKSKQKAMGVPNEMKPPYFFNIKYREVEEDCDMGISTPVFQEYEDD